jgi:type II secretory ATPase GspE/PulE/Tfp pilus assembly ATPase PilB-like protein
VTTVNPPAELPLPAAATSPDAFTAADLAMCVTEEAKALVPFEIALDKKVLPLMCMKNKGGEPLLRVVSHLEDRIEIQTFSRELQFITGVHVEVLKAPRGVIEDAILRSYLGSESLLRQRLARVEPSSARSNRSEGSYQALEGARGDAAQFLTAVVHHAAVRGASDLHLCPRENGAVIKMRLDGDLLVNDESLYSTTVHEQVVNRLKVLASLDISKKGIPQDGAFSFALGNRTVPVRISTIPCLYGESVVLRFLITRDAPRLGSLGLESLTVRKLTQQLAKKSGLILLTGPTGSGKTSTLYGSLSEVRKHGRNVVTVEDPVEIPLPGTTQVQVREDQGLSFPAAIRAVLRHDPDVLLIGEIRDTESARIALEAATTGHLTLSSLHTNSVLDVIQRLESLGIAARDVAGSLLMVVNQRLIPKLCLQCRVVDLSATRYFNTTVYQRVGCPKCSHTGYSGRVVVSESLVVEEHKTVETILRCRGRGELAEEVSSSAFIPWTRSLEHALVCGEISAEQFSSFIDESLPHL